IAVGHRDGRTQFWDAATGRPVGPPQVQRAGVIAVGFTADGQWLFSTTVGGDTRSWPVPRPASGRWERIERRIQALTGSMMDGGQAVVPLDLAVWRGLLERDGIPDPSFSPQRDPTAWQDERAQDAEQVGDAFAAAWHLDRLVAARPDDWLAFA